LKRLAGCEVRRAGGPDDTAGGAILVAILGNSGRDATSLDIVIMALTWAFALCPYLNMVSWRNF
jgi:hypothetical protein